METRWYHNAKTGEIESYHVDGDWTDFPRGTFLAYGDYLTTGFKTREAAVKWATEYGCCEKCKSSRPVKHGRCLFCRGKVVFRPIPAAQR